MKRLLSLLMISAFLLSTNLAFAVEHAGSPIGASHKTSYKKRSAKKAAKKSAATTTATTTTATGAGK